MNNKDKINISIAGASGRMGRMIVQSITNNQNAKIISATCDPVEKEFLGKDVGLLSGLPENGVIIGSDPAKLLMGDVIIDFTTPDISMFHTKLATEKSIPIVIGTTGLSDQNEKNLNEFSKNIPIVYASNMSVGVNLLFGLVEDAIKKAGFEWDVEILEMHHNKKIDSPSGTAVSLGKIAAKALNENYEKVSTFSRKGVIGKRKKNEIGFAVLRGGSVVGEHKVILATDNERIELSHKAETRKIFANGALRAAIWVCKRKPGLYKMKDVLGL